MACGSRVENTGTGIYSGRRGALAHFMAEWPETKILVATLPKVPGDEFDSSSNSTVAHTISTIENDKFRKDNLDQYHIEMLDFEVRLNHSALVCQGSACCAYNVTAKRNAISVVEVETNEFFLTNNTNNNKGP